MENKKIILCRGIQGSGKSTYARKWVLEDPEHRVRFNNDDIRNMLGKYWVPSREDLIYNIKHTFVWDSLKYGYDIIIDNMNLNQREIEFYKNIIENWNNPKGVISSDLRYPYELEFKDFFIPVEECIKRDSLRNNPIGEKVIRQTWNKYKDIIQTESINKYINTRLKQSDDKIKAIVLDIDNTLCFNVTGRPWYGAGSSEGMLTDYPNIPIIDLVNNYYDKSYYIFIITGRSISNELATRKWLENNGVNYDKIYFRNVEDYRHSFEIKKEIIESLLESYKIDIIIDDSDDVVKMYRDLGLTVLQPNNII